MSGRGSKCVPKLDRLFLGSSGEIAWQAMTSTKRVFVEATRARGNRRGYKLLAPVVRKVDNAIHWINHYPADSVLCFVRTYPLDSNLSGG